MIQQVGHLILCLAAIAAATLLCITGHIPATAAVGVIVTAVGGGVAGNALSGLSGSKGPNVA